MMITRLYLKNFRGVAEGDVQGFAQINLFVGPNNSGKTTILEALYLAATADRKSDVTLDTQNTDDDADGSVSWNTTSMISLSAEKDMLGHRPMSRIWQRHNMTPVWEDTPAVLLDNGTIDVSNLRAPLDVLGTIHLMEDRRGFKPGDEHHLAMLRVEPELVETDAGEKELQLPPFAATYFGDRAAPLENRSFCMLWHPYLTYNLNGIGGWFVEGNLPSAKNTLLHDFHTTSENLMFHMIERGYSDTDSFLRRTARQLQEIFRLPDEPYITFEVIRDQERRRGRVEQNQRMLLVDLWGDGMRHAMKLLAPLLILHDDASNGNPSVVLWEDPELFMNPTLLYAFLRHIALMIQNKPIQLFLTTHSIEVIACLAEMLRDGDVPKTSVKAFQLKLDDGKQRVVRFDCGSLLTWLELGKDPRVWEWHESPLSYNFGGVEE